MADRQKRIEAEELQKQIELEEALKLEEVRKAGQVEEDGHIPHSVAAPWYLLNAETPSLEHQKKPMQGPVQDTKLWYERGAKAYQALKFRKDDCEK